MLTCGGNEQCLPVEVMNNAYLWRLGTVLTCGGNEQCLPVEARNNAYLWR